jgi:hypothetical protein
MSLEIFLKLRQPQFNGRAGRVGVTIDIVFEGRSERTDLGDAGKHVFSIPRAGGVDPRIEFSIDIAIGVS